MNVVYIPEEKNIIIDGVPTIMPSIVPVAMHDGLHALQWNGDSGFLNWKDGEKRNTILSATDYDAHVKPYVTQCEAYIADRDAKEAAVYNSEAARFERLRARRDMLIADTDYLMMVDYPITEACREAFKVYRQALRDITSLEGAPWDGGDDGTTVPWPTKSAIVKQEA